MVLDIDGELCFESNKVANFINKFYTSIASVLVSKLPTPSHCYDTNSDAFINFYKNKGITPDGFRLLPVSTDFVFKEILRLNPNKSTGIDNIPVKFLKDGAKFVTNPITFIINLSISSSTIPDDLKFARVRPLFKKNSRLDVGNYRPVSILSVISKILERAVYIQVEKYLVDNNVLYDMQSGFRGSYSTDTCLTYLTDYIRTQMSVGNYTGMVLLDLQKAFDTVDHEILCQKLKAMGIVSVDWFKSYLTNRQQIVSVNQVESKPLNITCGVPQGSILGPLLFCVM